MRTLHPLLLLCALSIAVIGRAQPDTWTRVSDIGEANFSDSRLSRSSPVTFTLAGKAYMATGLVGTSVLNDLWEYDPTTNAWTQRANMPTLGRVDAVGFALNGKGYVATGLTVGDVYMNDMWEYDPTGNTWTQRANVPGALRSEALAFALGDTAYVGAGANATLQNDFYAYDRINNVWLARANLPAGSGRQAPAGFAVGGKGYSVGGFGGTFSNGLIQFDPLLNAWSARAPLPASGRMYGVAFSMGAFGYAGTGITSSSTSLNDFYQYDPVGDAWTPRTNVPGTGRRFAMGFSLNSLGYIGLGNGTTFKDDMHAFDPIANTWTARVGFGDKARAEAASFAVGGKGYVGGGYNDNVLADMWAFDPVPNSWAQQADLPGGARYGHVMFAVGSKGYMGTGRIGASYMNDFWEYDPSANTWLARAALASAFGVGRSGAVAFVIGSKGYICTGSDPTAERADLLEFDPLTNVWVPKASLPAFSRTEAAAFTIGTSGYVMGGFTSEFTGGSSSLNQLWSYQQPTNSWLQLPALTGERTGHVGFSIGSRGYVATGFQGSTLLGSLHEYDPNTATWTARATSPDVPRAGATAFVISDRAYVGSGAASTYVLPDFMKYEPLRDVTCTVIPSSGTLCPGGTNTINFSPNLPFNAGNVFTAQLSAAGGSFASPISLGTVTTAVVGSMNVVIPLGTPAGAGYRIRILASNPAVTGTISSSFTMLATCNNNEPCEAFLLTMNPNYTCAATTAGNINGFTLSPGITSTCAGVVQDMWYTFIATSTSHRIQLGGTTTGLTQSIFQGACGSLTQVAGSLCQSGSSANDPTGLVIGNAYWVRVSRTTFSSNAFTVCVSAPPLIDMRASALATPAISGCYLAAQPISITVLNNALTSIDLSVNPVTVSTNVSGTTTGTLTGTLSTGTLAPGGTANVSMSTTLDMSAGGAYTFNASSSVAGDGDLTNNAMTAAARTALFAKALPITQDFTGFTNGNLTNLAAPNDGWRTGGGSTFPTFIGGSLTASSAAQQTQLGSGPTVRVAFTTSQTNPWVLSPKFVPVVGTEVGYRIAITDLNLATPEPAGMQPGESFIVHISTDCGTTYTPLFTHNSTNTAGLTNTLIQKSVDLSGFAGQQVVIAFQFLKANFTGSHPGYEFHLDDINIRNTTACTGNPASIAIGLTPAGVLCAPASGTLSVTGLGAATGVHVSWYSSAAPGGPFAVIPNASGPFASLVGLPLGTTYVVASAKCSAGTDSTLSAPFQVVVQPRPTLSATANTPVCEGQTLNFVGTTDIGNTFAWTGPSGYTSAALSPAITPVVLATAGMYTLNCSLNGCAATPAAVVVAVNKRPTINSLTATPATICVNGSSQFQVSARLPGPVTGYNFSSTAGTFSSIVGQPGTVVVNNGSFNTGYGPFALGFTFNYNNINFTTAGMSDNGFIALGANPGNSTNILASGSSFANNVIVAFNASLRGLTANGAQMSYQLAGIPGSRVFTFQWTNWGFFAGLNEVSFQIKLLEGTDQVQLVYQNGTATTSGFVRVGLRGTTTDEVAARAVTTNWAASITTTDPFDNCVVSATVRPTNGLTYTWTPPSANVAWSPATFLNSTTITNPLASGVTATTTYTITATDPLTLCATTSSVSVSLSTVDTDGDGIVDCIDNCPTVAGQIGSACDDGNAGTVNDVLIAGCVCQGTVGANVLVSARVILDGPYDSGTGLMADGMRALGLVPTTEPYTSLGYTLVGGGSVTTTAPVLAITGSNAVVDWVVLELRSSAAPTTILASRSALVQRDGDVVDVDGTSPVSFSIANGSYHVAVLHRNHLGCMTAATVVLSAASTPIHFTDPALPTFGTDARQNVSGSMVLWSGDVVRDGVVKYVGSSNDRDPILIDVGGNIPTNIATGYSATDVNLDGVIKYVGSNNDRDPILVNVGGNTPNNTRSQQLP